MSIIPTCVCACDHIYIYIHTHSQVNDTYWFIHINYTNIYTCMCELYIHTDTQLYTTHETSGSERKPKSVLLSEAAVGATSYVGFPIPCPHWTLRTFRWDLQMGSQMGPSHTGAAHRRGALVLHWLLPSGPPSHSGMMVLGLTVQAFLNWLEPSSAEIWDMRRELSPTLFKVIWLLWASVSSALKWVHLELPWRPSG